MNAKDLRIIFMGTPEFAATSLRRLVTEGYNIVAVVTTPDKPAGADKKYTRATLRSRPKSSVCRSCNPRSCAHRSSSKRSKRSNPILASS